MERKDCDTYVLSTGREIRANNGIIGLQDDASDDPQIGPFSLFEGYDGPLHPFPQDMTAAELEELADFMIEQWNRFKVAACRATGDHDWAPWRQVSDFPGGGPYIDQRFCRRCLIEETAPKATHTLP